MGTPYRPPHQTGAAVTPMIWPSVAITRVFFYTSGIIVPSRGVAARQPGDRWGRQHLHRDRELDRPLLQSFSLSLVHYLHFSSPILASWPVNRAKCYRYYCMSIQVQPGTWVRECTSAWCLLPLNLLSAFSSTFVAPPFPSDADHLIDPEYFDSHFEQGKAPHPFAWWLWKSMVYYGVFWYYCLLHILLC